MNNIIDENVINPKNLEKEFNSMMDLLRLHKNFKWSEITGESNLYTDREGGKHEGNPYFTYEVKDPFEVEGGYKIYPSQTNRYPTDETKITLSNGELDDTSFESGVVKTLSDGTVIGLKISDVYEGTYYSCKVYFEIYNKNYNLYLNLCKNNPRFTLLIDSPSVGVDVDWESFTLKSRQIKKVRDIIKKVCNLPKDLLSQKHFYSDLVERDELDLYRSKTFLADLTDFMDSL